MLLTFILQVLVLENIFLGLVSVMALDRHAQIQKVLSEGVQLWCLFFLLIDEGRADPNCNH